MFTTTSLVEIKIFYTHPFKKSKKNITMNKARLENGWGILPNNFEKPLYSGNFDFCKMLTFLLLFLDNINLNKTDFLRLIPDHPHHTICSKWPYDHFMVLVRSGFRPWKYYYKLGFPVFSDFHLLLVKIWILLKSVNPIPNHIPHPILSTIPNVDPTPILYPNPTFLFPNPILYIQTLVVGIAI